MSFRLDLLKKDHPGNILFRLDSDKICTQDVPFLISYISSVHISSYAMSDAVQCHEFTQHVFAGTLPAFAGNETQLQHEGKKTSCGKLPMCLLFRRRKQFLHSVIIIILDPNCQ